MKTEINLQDEIIRAVRRTREAHAAQFNFDLKAIARDMKLGTERLRKQGWKVESRIKKATKATA